MLVTDEQLVVLPLQLIESEGHLLLLLGKMPLLLWLVLLLVLVEQDRGGVRGGEIPRRAPPVDERVVLGEFGGSFQILTVFLMATDGKSELFGLDQARCLSGHQRGAARHFLLPLFLGACLLLGGVQDEVAQLEVLRVDLVVVWRRVRKAYAPCRLRRIRDDLVLEPLQPALDLLPALVLSTVRRLSLHLIVAEVKYRRRLPVLVVVKLV